jgi:hypothetical protein
MRESFTRPSALKVGFFVHSLRQRSTFSPIVVHFRAQRAKMNNNNGDVPCCRRQNQLEVATM